MSPVKPSFNYQEVGVEKLESIRLMWEGLNRHHVALSSHFSARRLTRTFDARKQEFEVRARAGKLRIELAFQTGSELAVAYCITSLLSGVGEIDSIFVEEAFRGCGLGGELMRHALHWLDGHGATSKTAVVAHGNDPAINFYSQFGFRPDNVFLRQVG
jgi:ribosomal protein S18 acetylase RimI-like enzyme